MSFHGRLRVFLLLGANVMAGEFRWTLPTTTTMKAIEDFNLIQFRGHFMLPLLFLFAFQDCW